MPFAIVVGNDGLPICPCCRDMLWHCKRCWNKYHNGEKDKDYEPPKFFGQSMMNDDTIEKMNKEFNIKHNPSIKPNKERKYKEGFYGH